MNWFPHLNCNIPTKCINLRTRGDKLKWIKKHLNRKKIKAKFHIVKKHRNPKRGCLESHLTCIKNALENGEKYLLMLEDDAKFLRKIDTFPNPPDNWEMLYLGGTIRELLDDSENSDNWQRVRCWTTHA